jgi:hypothetical protein
MQENKTSLMNSFVDNNPIDWPKLNRANVAKLKPSLVFEILGFLQELLFNNREAIREAIRNNPQTWWAEYHSFWGMMVRNELRKAGFGEKELGIDNLDDYYIGLIELALERCLYCGAHPLCELCGPGCHEKHDEDCPNK